ncbi:MAG: DUF4177 domain-containing protein [Pirellulales bacterium]|nr:DUF4177 domain-containing protein [Pirellulales bacterium]
MRALSRTLSRHRAILWGLVFVVLGVLLLNVAAAPAVLPGQWQYKTVVFHVQEGDSVAQQQRAFESILNREAANGWEFVAPCARLSGNGFGIDYLVLRRRVQ